MRWCDAQDESDEKEDKEDDDDEEEEDEDRSGLLSPHAKWNGVPLHKRMLGFHVRLEDSFSNVQCLQKGQRRLPKLKD